MRLSVWNTAERQALVRRVEEAGSVDSPVATTMNPNAWQLDRRWLILRHDSDPEESCTSALSIYRSVVLLGAAGAGKTVEAKRLAESERAAGRDVRECRLAEHSGSSDELSHRLDELASGASDNTVLYLDALDEAMIPLRRAGLIIRNWIDRTLLQSGAALRITCRSAVWPDLLSAKMRELGGQDASCTAMLQPLSNADIAVAAKSGGIDADQFLAEIESRRAEVLAAQPLTLRMLFRLYSDSRGLPSTVRELFSVGLHELASDRYERFEIGTVLDLSPAELIAAAERLACYTLLSGRDTIDLGDSPPTDRLGWSELAGLEDGGPHLARETLQAIGSSGICDSASVASFRFGHRQFAEYLAGERLARLLPHQAKALLASPAGWKSGAAGPLRETAAFAAMASPEIAAWLAHTDPEVVGLSDVADPELRRTATLGLLDRFRQGRMTDAQVGRGELELRGFQYANAEDDLRPVLRERGDQCEDVLECAVELIESWQLESMSDDLADLVLDTNAPHHVRKSAGYALCKLGTDNARERLKPLIAGTSDDDHSELKGLALRCNWPDRLAVPELLNALTARPDSSYHGAYDGFLWELERAQFSAEGHLADGLRWARSHFSSLGDSDPAHRIAMRIVHASVFNLDDPEVATELVAVLQGCASAHINSPLGPLRRSGFARHDDEPELPAPLASNDAVRRQLIDALAQATDTPRDLWWLAHETPGLCVAEDFLWLLGRGCDESQSMVVRQNYLEVARWLPWTSRSEHVDAWITVRDIEPVSSVLDYPMSIELNSEHAAKLREQWREMKAMEEPQEPQGLDQPPRERVLQALELAETKDARFFFNLCRELTLEPTSTHYGFERFLTNSPGWGEADERTRERIVEAAKRLLLADIDDPESCRNEPLNSILLGCMAAILIVLEKDPDWLAARGAEWWQRWCWYILRELHPAMHGEPEEPKHALITLLASEVPGSVRDELARLASSGATEAGHLLSSLLRLLDQCPDTVLDERLCEMLSAGEVAPPHLFTVMQFVLDRLPETARAACEQIIDDPGPDEDESPAVLAATALLFECPAESAPVVLRFIAANQGHGRRVLQKFAHGSRWRSRSDDLARPLDHLTPLQWGELAGLLLKLFPPEDDPQHDGAHWVGPGDSARDLRDRLISALGDRDDHGAVVALRQLEEQFGDRYRWLRRPRARAERSYRLSQWNPIPLNVVADLLELNAKRLIRSDDDVMSGIEAALEAYAQAIRQDGPESVEDLWNTRKGESPSPKAEEHISNKLCGAVRAYFRDYAIAADREVEIHRRSVSQASGGEPGSELDVLVQLPAQGSGSGSRIRIPLEVKLSCNDQVKTAMKDQLADRYIPQLGATHGLYVVAWMSVPDINTLREGHRPKWSTLDAARAELEAQASGLSESEGVVIRAITLDAALR